MQALLKQEPGPGLALVGRDPPALGFGEVLVRIHAAGICGTDLVIDRWEPWIADRLRLPVVIGHEGMGVVEQVGPGVTNVSLGDRVGIETHVACGSCRNCLSGREHICSVLTYVGMHVDGVFTERAVIAARLLFRLPNELPDEVAVLLEPLGLAVRAAKSGAGVDSRTVLVTGVGPIGAMACAIARRFGATRILASEIGSYRLDFARQHADVLGIDRVLDASSENVGRVARDLTNGDGADLWIDFAGGERAFQQGLDALRPGGEAHLFAPVNGTASLTRLVLKEITAYGLHGRVIFDTWFDSVAVGIELQDALVPLVTHSLRLDDYERAFALAHRGETMKLVFAF